MTLFTIDDVRRAARLVNEIVPPTPAYAWPLLAKRVGFEVIVKHENHTPTGSFKARGGLVYMDAMGRGAEPPSGFVTATRGNHGQSIAIGAARANVPAVIVVPEGNSVEKNAAMEAFGGQVMIAGKDFDESREVAGTLQNELGYQLVPSFHRDLVLGVSTYAVELFEHYKNIDTVYVPIGMGSGICGLITIRDLLGLKTEIVGVVAENADAFAQSFEAGHIVTTDTANTFADGMACRTPMPEPFEIIKKGAARIIRVSEQEIAEAIRVYYTDTHNIAEGAGAAPLAALLKDRNNNQSKRAAVILCGGNIDMTVYKTVLQGQTPGT